MAYFIKHGRRYGADYEGPVRRTVMSSSGEVFWDVGANTGYYTIKLAPRFTHVVAFEPDPTAARILERKLSKKRVHNVTVMPVALADTSGKSILHLFTKVKEKTVGSSSSLIERPGTDTDVNTAVPTVEVQTGTVDDLLDNGKIDLMKIDVEGAEFMVLGGARNSLREHRIHQLVIELHDNGRKDELNSLLAKYGYITEWLDYNPTGGPGHVLASITNAN